MTVLRVCRSHILTVLSCDAEARVVPSDERDIDLTLPACPRSVARSLPAAASHIYTALPREWEASVAPSGEYTILQTWLGWPEIVVAFPVATSQRLTSPSSDAVARAVPSGENETARTRSVLAIELGDNSPRRRVPKYDFAVPSPGHEDSAIRRKRDAGNTAIVIREDSGLCARRYVPQPDGSVNGNGGEGFPIRGKVHGVDIAMVSLQGGGNSTRFHIPQPDPSVLVTGSEGGSIRRKHKTCRIGLKHFIRPQSPRSSTRRHIP